MHRDLAFDGDMGYSEPIALYDFENNSVIGSEVFIFNGDEIIGKMEVYDTENGYVSRFDTCISDDIVLAYEEGEEIAMGYVEDSMLMYSASETYILISGPENYVMPSLIPQELNAITVTGESPAYLAASYSHLHTIIHNITHVQNSSTVFSGGECWAACLAMKLNYEQNRNGSNGLEVLDADSVAWECWRIGNYGFKNGVPTVFHDNELAMYEHYDYPYIQVSNDPLTHLEIHDILSQGWPLVMSVTKDNESSGHVMLIYGTVLDSTFSTYYVDDPNSGTVTFTFAGNPSKTATNFSYGIYNNWRYTYY